MLKFKVVFENLFRLTVEILLLQVSKYFSEQS